MGEIDCNRLEEQGVTWTGGVTRTGPRQYCQILFGIWAQHSRLRLTVWHQVRSFSFPTVRAHACFLWNSECYPTRKKTALLVNPISSQRCTISSLTMKRRRTPSPDNTIMFLLCRRSIMHKVLDMLASTIRTKSSIKTRPTNIQCSHSVLGYVERVHCIHDRE